MQELAIMMQRAGRRADLGPGLRRDERKRAAMAACLLAGLVLAGAAQAASPAAGLWATPEENGRVEVRDCGGGLCGFVENGDHIRADPNVTDNMNKNPALRGRRLKGVALFEGMRGGPRKWTGKVYNPVDGGIYSGSVVLLAPDRLKLQGCIVWPLCKSQVWKRVD